MHFSKALTCRSEPRLPGMTRPLRPVPVFKQRPGETQKRFLRRMELGVKDVIEKKKYEDKYGVEVHHDVVTGEARITDRPKDEVDAEVEEARRKRLAKKGITVKSKEEKRQARRQKEKEKRMKKKRRLRKQLLNADGEWEDEEAVVDFDDMKDPVGVNEVADAPPTLKGLAEARKPAKNSSLLLHKKLEKAGARTMKSGKVSMAKKQMLETERQRVIDYYRNMKAGKLGKVGL